MADKCRTVYRRRSGSLPAPSRIRFVTRERLDKDLTRHAAAEDDDLHDTAFDLTHLFDLVLNVAAKTIDCSSSETKQSEFCGYVVTQPLEIHRTQRYVGLHIVQCAEALADATEHNQTIAYQLFQALFVVRSVDNVVVFVVRLDAVQ